jgi:hypothetical protein
LTPELSLRLEIPVFERMSTDWFFVRDGAREGPRSRAEMEALFSTGVLSPETLVWSSGMPSWQAAVELPEFQYVTHRPGSPPPIPPSERTAPAGSAPEAERARSDIPQAAAGDTTPHPWLRWAARLIDFGCFCIVLGVVGELVAPGAMLRVNEYALNVVALALMVPVEAMVLSSFGTTPGKALLKIRLANADGSRLDFGTAFTRSFQVWMRGLAFGIPLVMLFSMAVAHSRLADQGSTSWDEALGLSVTHSRVGVLGWIALAVFFVLVLLAVGSSIPAEGVR